MLNQKTFMVHRMILNSRVSCVVRISVFGFYNVIATSVWIDGDQNQTNLQKVLNAKTTNSKKNIT